MDTNITLQQYQEQLLKALKFFDSLCRENGIKYTVLDGTLLGTIRHKGIIPWDGDIDVALTPSELEKLKRAFANYDGRYFLNYSPGHYYKVKGRIHDFPTLTCKIVDRKCSSGIFGIDVFTIDFLGDNLEYAQNTIAIYKKYYNLMRFTTSFHKPEHYSNIFGSFKSFMFNLAYPILKAVSVLLSPSFESSYCKFRRKRIDSNSETCKYFTIQPYLGRFGVNENTFLKDGYIDLPFEDMYVMVAKNYDVYLRGTYGDYMQLPPEDKRIPYPSQEALTSCIFEE